VRAWYEGGVKRPALLVVLLAALAASCKHEAAGLFSEEDRKPVPAPASLVAEGALKEPDAFWRNVRKGSGAALAASSDTAAGALLAWMGADSSLAPLINGSTPFYLALGDAADGGTAWALAMKLAKPAAVRAALVEGETSRFRSEEADGMTRLLPREGSSLTSTPGTAAAITATGYVVVASSAADLASLGAYAARTLPTKELPESAFGLVMNAAALGRTGRRSPDFTAKATSFLADALTGTLPQEVDPKAVAACFGPGIQGTGDLIGDLAEARLAVDADDAHVSAAVTLVAKPGDSGARKRIQAMHPASAAPLLDAPAHSVVALFASDAADVRADDVSTLGPCLGAALAPILGSGGASKLAGAMTGWTQGRGDWETVALVVKPSVAGMVLRSPVKDAAKASASVRAFVDLASQPGVADTMRRVLPLRAGQVQPVDVPPVGKASLLMFPGHAAPARSETDPTTVTAPLAPPGLAWAVNDEIDVGLGQSPKDLLALTHAGTTLRTTARIAAAVNALGADASFAAVVVPPGCCASGSPASTPLTLGWGRKGEDDRITLDVGDELLGQVLAHELTR
jgi:hypothetical protein